MKPQERESVWEKFSGPNIGYLVEIYEKYKENPNTIDPSLRTLFDEEGPPPYIETNQSFTTQIQKIISAMKLFNNIRTLGHLCANINPLKQRSKNRLLELDEYHLSEEDLQQIPIHLLWKDAPLTLQNGWDGYQHLKKVYTNTIAYEFGHIHDEKERDWLEHYIENKEIQLLFTQSQKIELLTRLIEVDCFETFLHKTFVGQKRFSIEGLDMLVPMLDKLIEAGIADKVENMMIGMAHRGRLNVLAHVLGKPYKLIFSEFHHSPNKELVPSEGSRGINYGWSGDVKYHLGATRRITDENERTIRVHLANNPSHLEFVNPVVQGQTRASQENNESPGYPKQNKQSSFSVYVHGDAAFPGEGVVAETLNLSRLKGYETGGAIHIIANNQLGFTTDHEDSRSTHYASDLAKGFEIPIIHVNADDPESCLAVMLFAYEYRKQFQKDVLIDLIGYRRFGHNEMDDPHVTQPHLYREIMLHPTVSAIYAKALISNEYVTENEVAKRKEEQLLKLQQIFNQLSNEKQVENPITQEVGNIPNLDTSISRELLQSINLNLLKVPNGFHIYPKLKRILQRREAALSGGNAIDWALAETLAFGSILAEGKAIRLTGQDSERGTFAHRHLVLHDEKTNETYIPLHHFPEAKASFSIYNSPLSETAVLGFEYGYSVHASRSLVIWEAQFGDFVNVAQPIIDQFIAAGKAKWGQQSSLVMLLPHGYEGQGPEHSSGRMERFLQAAAENNLIVANVTSAAQYFHLLRRQAKLAGTLDARPLIIMTPKSLLRHPRTASSEEELSSGRFKPIVEQILVNHEKIKRLILCSGKIAIDLETRLEEVSDEEKECLNIARVEQLYPFPLKEVQQLIESCPNITEVMWVQEEPENMGGWSFVRDILERMLPDHMAVTYTGRPKRSSPATGEPHIHKQEQTKIVEEALSVQKGGEGQ